MVAGGADPGAEYLIVGSISKAHGIKGDCFVMPATDDVAGIYAKGCELRLGDPQGRPLGEGTSLTVREVRRFKGGLIVSFDAVDDRNAAEVLRGLTLLARRADTRPLEEGEYFLHDLPGLDVYTVQGARVGRVAEVYEGGPSHYLGVVDDGEREHLVPFIAGVVREVDLRAGRIVIEPIPGLLDL
ncbi:MAG: 16S rRNA processing protein RimM [Gemmatimonadota bacterium]|nr:MAG: 16S rRNA processing protein RimM [Gemmatimonadota bacterium]